MGRGLSELQRGILGLALLRRREREVKASYFVHFTDTTTKQMDMNEIYRRAGQLDSRLVIRLSRDDGSITVAKLPPDPANDTYAAARRDCDQLRSAGLDAYVLAHTEPLGANDVIRDWILSNFYGESWQALRYIDKPRYQAAFAALSKALARLEDRGLLVRTGITSLILTEDGMKVAEPFTEDFELANG